MGELVSLAERRWWSGFDVLFSRGMTLVEETATYLDGPGRLESGELPDPLRHTYATVSMRATTLLMQLVSWLLLVRAFKEKELSEPELQAQLTRLRMLASMPLAATELPQMPETICSLIQRTNTLLAEIQKAEAEYLTKEGIQVPQSASG